MVKIITLNINGIKTNTKQDFLNQFLSLNKPDILALQETNINEFRTLHVGYNIIINNNIENYKSGTIIIYKKDLEMTSIEKAEDGRIIRANFKDFIIVNIYAPTHNEKAENRHLFFLHTLPKFLKASDQNLILLGDFNSIIDSRDREGLRKKINYQLKNLIEKLNLIDAFRTKNEDVISFTYISPNGKSRIDRIYIPEVNRNRIEKCAHLNFPYSDHNAVLLELRDSNSHSLNRKNLWKLNTSILEDPEFQEELHVFILKAKQLLPQFTNIVEWWEKEIKENFKIVSQRYCKKKNKEKNSVKKFLNNCLEQVKKEIDEGHNKLDEYYYFKNKLKNIHKKEEEGKQIRGKLNYPVNNEICTVANLIKEKSNGENRRIEELEENGTVNPDVHKVIHSFYKNLYSLNNHDPLKRNEILEYIDKIINTEMNEKLTKSLSEEEVWDAIKSLQEGKSPGVDGLPIEFYKKTWPFLKEEITNMYTHILKFQHLSNTQSSGIITLLHKGGCRKKLGNWRPISLLCSDYKILAKILTIRLKNILPDIISEEQTGGIQNRDITQNLVTYRNIIEYFSSQNHQRNNEETSELTRYKKRGAAIVSLDFEKAYDMVDRTFLFEVLRKLGFNEIFINYIKALYENANSKVFTNNEFGESIYLKRGVRQGCPLSMYLYILFIDPFLKFIKRKIQPTQISQSSHQISAFVDDISIFIQNLTDIEKLENCIEIFEKATNSKVNRTKSYLLKLGAWKNEIQWPNTWIKSQESIKMLGIHWYEDVLTTIDKNSAQIIEKIKKSILNTFNRLLTIQQKVIFFNSFIVTKFSHIAKILPIPKIHTDKIQQLGHIFIWKHRLESLAKTELYPPIREGGLNFTNAKTKYQSLFLKTILNNLTEEKPSENGKMMFYWLGLGLRKIFPVKKGPNCEKTPQFLANVVEIIKKLNKNRNITQIITSKEIYTLLTAEEQKIPKIILKYPNTNFKPGFLAITKPFLSPYLKEHLFLQIHNTLTTKDRLIKCKQDISPKCDQCNENENVEHLFECKTTKPAVNFIKRRISNYYHNNFTPTTQQIYLLDFPSNPKTSQNQAIFLAANLSLIVWKKRKKAKFMMHFMNSLKKSERNIEQHPNFQKWFFNV